MNNNSSAEKLIEIARKIGGIDFSEQAFDPGFGEHTHFMGSNPENSFLGMAVNDARSIASKFQGVNQSLVETWEKIADSLNKINDEISSGMYDLISAILNFADTTIANETSIKEAVAKTNSDIDSIMASIMPGGHN